MRIPRSLSPSSPDRTHPVAVGGEMKLEMADGPVVAASAPTSATFSSFRLLQVLILALTVAGVVDRPAGRGTGRGRASRFGGVRAHPRLGARRLRRHPCARSHRFEGLAVPSHCRVDALRGHDRSHGWAAGQSCSMRRAVRVTSPRWRPSWSPRSRSISSSRCPTAGCTESSRRGAAVIAYVAALGVGIGLVVDHAAVHGAWTAPSAGSSRVRSRSPRCGPAMSRPSDTAGNGWSGSGSG